MKNITVVVSVLVVVSGCDADGPTSPSAPPATYTLSGRVAEAVEDGTFEVAGVEIREERSSRTAISDENGMYSLSGLQAIDNVIHARKPGYVSGRTPVTISADTRLDLTIFRATGYVLSGVTFEVTPNGNVPVEGVDIYCDGCGEDGHTGLRTDASGSYTFPFVYPGVQYLQVGKAGYRPVDPVSPLYLGISVTVNGNTQFNIQLVRQ